MVCPAGLAALGGMLGCGVVIPLFLTMVVWLAAPLTCGAADAHKIDLPSITALGAKSRASSAGCQSLMIPSSQLPPQTIAVWPRPDRHRARAGQEAGCSQ